MPYDDAFYGFTQITDVSNLQVTRAWSKVGASPLKRCYFPMGDVYVTRLWIRAATALSKASALFTVLKDGTAVASARLGTSAHTGYNLVFASPTAIGETGSVTVNSRFSKGSNLSVNQSLGSPTGAAIFSIEWRPIYDKSWQNKFNKT